MEQEFKFIVDPAEPIFTFEDEPNNSQENLEDFEDGLDAKGSETGEEAGSERTLKVRLDKWLWAARFFKTRALARAAVEAGKVFYNGERSKPSREIEIGALLQIRQGRFEKTVTVTGLSTRRRSTDEALQLFEESEESKFMREQQTAFEHPQHQFQQDQFSSYPDGHDRRSVRFLRRSFGRTPDGRENDYRGDRQPSYPPQYSQGQHPNHYPNQDSYAGREQYPNREYHPRDQYGSREHYSNREPYPSREPHSNRDPYPNRGHYSNREQNHPDPYRNAHSDYQQGYPGRNREYSQYPNSPHSNSPYPNRTREYSSPYHRNRDSHSSYPNRNREYSNPQYQHPNRDPNHSYPNQNREYPQYPPNRNREYPSYPNQPPNAYPKDRADYSNMAPPTNRGVEFEDQKAAIRTKESTEPKSRKFTHVEFEIEE